MLPVLIIFDALEGEKFPFYKWEWPQVRKRQQVHRNLLPTPKYDSSYPQQITNDDTHHDDQSIAENDLFQLNLAHY